MNRALGRSLAFSTLLWCSVVPAAADDTDGRWLNPVLASESGAGQELQLMNRTEVDLGRTFAGEALTWGNNRFSVPVQQETWRLDSRRSLLINALAIEWQHSVGATNLLTLGARYGDSLYSDPALSGASGTAATVSWSTLFGGESRVIGRLYVGDEEAKERTNGNTDHRYYGLHLEGRYGLWRDHSPFASLKWQRNNYELPDSNGLSGSLFRNESFSRFAAGWNWQVRPSWDVRAEANYRLTDDTVDAAESDRTQLHFSTRYGFR
jgi:hypothetical protein